VTSSTINRPWLLTAPTVDIQRETLTEWLQTAVGPQLNISSNPDIHWVNPEGEPLKIEVVRDLQHTAAFQAFSGQSFFLFLNLEAASPAAQNALLKFVEEPATHVTILAATDQPGRLLATLRSRFFIQIDTRTTEITIERERELAEIYQNLLKLSEGEAIKRADDFSDRLETITWLSVMVKHLHALPTTSMTVKHQQASLKAIELLAQNVNLKLVMGEYFLAVNGALKHS